jgi:ankyrin repeat protein
LGILVVIVVLASVPVLAGEIHEDVMNGDSAKGKTMSQDNPSVANDVDPDHGTPLHVAAWYNRVEIARILLQNHANVNGRDSTKATALHVAAWKGQIDVAEVLLDNGADVNATDEDGTTPLKLAIVSKHDEVARLLRNHGGHD